MKVLIDICHPAHAHFFRHPLRLLRERGHEIVITSRVKEMATDLLDAMGFEHRTLSSHSGNSVSNLCRELVLRNLRLYRFVRSSQPDVMAAIGGIFVAQVGYLTRIPALVFYDTENAHLQNALTYPLAHRVLVPDCYQGATPKRSTVRYLGYHELSYLHPKRFSPDHTVAIANGLASTGDTFLVRLVSWKSNHDLKEQGWSLPLLEHIVSTLTQFGRVLISSESDLPDRYSKYRYPGDPASIHHVLAFCRGFIGESATMASEAAVLGVPAVYAAHTPRGYTTEQEVKFGLVRNVPDLTTEAIEAAIFWIVGRSCDDWQRARRRLLEQTVDVAELVANAIESRGASVDAAPNAVFCEGRER